ncbi:MAG: hypothetical protein C0631_03395 [Sedimenticola sp.]|jgi:hypothetical protein|nr:MAG: hypothetical protein C0631_03395 [Sedimenticola sp.]
MAEIIPFKRPKASERHKGNTLCRQGHHKWQLDKESVFDVTQGKLVSRYQCSRCGKIKNQAN